MISGMFGSFALHAAPVLGAVIPAAVRDLTSILIALLLAIALVGRAPAVRWFGAVTALIVAPLLLAGVVLEDSRAERLLDNPALLAGGIAAGLVLVGLLAAAFVRWPSAFPVAVAVVLPLRLPITLGDESVNLLLPLYGLIGAGTVAFAYRARRRGKQLEQSWDLRTGPPAGQELRDAWTRRSLSGIAATVPMLLALTVLIYAIRIPFSEDADQGAQTLCFFLVPFAVLYVILRDIEFTPGVLGRIGVAFGVLAVIAVALGVYEYETGQVLWKQNILDAQSLNQAVRVNSLFFDPNVYGRFLMVVLIGVVAILAWGARGARAIGLWVLLIVLWGGLLISFSQSSMAGLLVGTLVLVGLRFGAMRALAAGGMIALCGVIAVAGFGDALRINVNDRDSVWKATAGRSALIEGGIDLFTQRPVQGWGSGSFKRVYRQQTKMSSVRAVAASHTIPVTVAVEQGIIGLAAYIALLVAALAALLRGAGRSLPRAAIAAAFAGLVVHTWLYAAFLEDPITWALLAVGLSLCANGSREAGAAGVLVPEPPAPSGSGAA